MIPSLPVSSSTEIALIHNAGSGQVVPFVPRRKTPAEAAEEFFNARISNENTRESYLRDAKQFASWCVSKGYSLEEITPVHVSMYRDHLANNKKRPATIKRHLSALWMLFSHLVATGAMPYNPAREVKTQPIRRAEGKTPALDVEQMHQLFESFNPEKPIDLRDRALIGVMAYTFSRVSAACQLTGADYIDLGRRVVIRLKEKGGVEREIPCHPVLAEYMDAWIKHAGIAGNADIFQTFTGQDHKKLSGRAISRDEALKMVKRRLARVELSSLIFMPQLSRNGDHNVS